MISQKPGVFKLEPVKGLTFNDKDGKHIHLIEGKEVPGCTSISGLFSDDGWKFAWPPKLMEEQLLVILKSGIPLHEDHLKKAKNAWREKRDRSADSGTQAHSIIEKYIKTGLTEMFVVENNEVENCVENFLSWEKAANPIWLASEIQVGSLKHSFAGILDALAQIDGGIVLVDFKTSSGIKPDYNIQLAGLCICLEEMGLKVDRRAILHLPKKGEFEYKEIRTDLEFEKKCFLAGLEHYRHKNMFLGKNEYKK